MHFSFETLGTHWWVELFDVDHQNLVDTLAAEIMTHCRQFNDAYSRFLPDSYISILNRERVLNQPTPACVALIQKGRDLYTTTEGACNMLVGHVLEARGYGTTQGRAATSRPDAEHAGNPLSDIIVTDERITLLNGNVDLGGYGKGYLIDELAQMIYARGFPFFLINGGGDIYVTSNAGAPVTILLEHPLDTTRAIAETTLMHEGFAASSPFKRTWTHGHTTHHHIVGGEAHPLQASFVKATTTVEADAFAKNCLLNREDTLITLSQTTNIAFARFDHTTNHVWYTKNFVLTPY